MFYEAFKYVMKSSVTGLFLLFFICFSVNCAYTYNKWDFSDMIVVKHNPKPKVYKVYTCVDLRLSNTNQNKYLVLDKKSMLAKKGI